MDSNSASSSSAPGYFTPETQRGGSSAPTSNQRESAVASAPAPTSNPREDSDGQKRMGKRREALNKAKAAKEAVSGAAGKVRREVGDRVREARDDFRSNRAEQKRA